MRTKSFWHWQLVDATWEEWCSELRRLLRTKNLPLQIIFTPNPEQVMLAEHNLTFRADLAQADYLLPDGQGIVWASRVRQRLTGADSVVEILRLSKKMHCRVMLIGGRYESQDQQLCLTIEGVSYQLTYTSGYDRIAAPTPAQERAVSELLARTRPDVVLVALGAPWQERWIIQHRQELSAAGVRLAMAVGGSFDFLTGKLRRAPRWWQRARLEWLYRLIQEPSRWRRQLALPVFAIKKLTGSWRTVQATPQTGE